MAEVDREVRLTIALVVLLVVGCSSGPSAVEVAEALRDGGVPITYDIVATTDGAVTATEISDIDVSVHASAEDATAARIRVIDVAAGPGLRVAQCGRILVFIVGAPSDDDALRIQREDTQAVLEREYGPC